MSINQLALADVVDQVFLIPASAHRCITSQGVRINHLYYWHPIFNDLNLQGQRVLVKYDLENLGSAWVYVHEQWVECFSKYHSIFRGLSKSQAQELSMEIYKNHSQRSKKVKKVLPVFDEALQDEILRSLSWKDQGHKNINNQCMSNDHGDYYDAPD